jgi:hypothetical protein
VRVDLDLVSERRFAGGVVHVHYRARGGEGVSAGS